MKYRRISFAIIAFSVFIALTGCSGKQESVQFRTCMDFLYRYMTVDDDLLHTRDFWEENVKKTLEVRKKMGWNVPDREFMYFVLPLRSCQEEVDDFRTTYADTLCSRVSGMSMADAAVEINQWCREQAIYDGSVHPGESPMETAGLGAGTCTELSGLLVCALRAAGIPARQVCVNWAHASGAHSWVEVWSDGQWHYMGGCEPFPKLDFNWVWNVAPRVMLASIYVFGDYDGPETILWKNSNFTAISNLGRYAPEKDLKIIAMDAGGKPVSGASVRFLVGKGEKKRIIHAGVTGADGSFVFRTGFGDCAVFASMESACGAVKTGSQDKVAIVKLDMGEAQALAIVKDMDLVPPVVSTVPGTPEDWEDYLEEENRRNAISDSIRVSTHRQQEQ